MIIKRITQYDTLSVMKIWKECFTNDIEYISTFIRESLPHTITLGLSLNRSESIVSMLSLMPAYSFTREREEIPLNGGYLYGVGTLTEHRGRGYSALLIEEAFNIALENNWSFMVVRPAEESLYNLYKRESFNIVLNERELIIEIDAFLKENSSMRGYCTKAQVIEKESYFDIREHSLKESHILWSRAIFNYAYIEAIGRGGNFYMLESASKEPTIYALYPNSSSHLNIIDHNINSLDILIKVVKEITKSYPSHSTLNISFSPISLSKEIEKLCSPNKNSLIKIFTKNSQESATLTSKIISLPIE